MTLLICIFVFLDWEIHKHWKLLWKPVLSPLISEFYFFFVLHVRFYSCLIPFQLLNAKVRAFQDGKENIEYQAASWGVEMLGRALEGNYYANNNKELLPDGKDVFSPEEWSQILNKLVQAPVGFDALLVER